MCYTIGVNRTGLDNNNLEYIGHSQVIDFLGNNIIEPQKSDDIRIVNLDKNEMLSSRKKLGFLKDRD